MFDLKDEKIAAEVQRARTDLKQIKSMGYLKSLVGTLGTDPAVV